MPLPRLSHTATDIPEPINQILLFGGATDTSTPSKTYDLFDVNTQMFVYSGTTVNFYVDHTVSLLNDKKTVLILGGADPKTGAVKCETFNVETKIFITVPCLKTPRVLHTATVIESTGNILVCYGYTLLGGTFPNDCELYSPPKL